MPHPLECIIVRKLRQIPEKVLQRFEISVIEGFMNRERVHSEAYLLLYTRDRNMMNASWY